MMKKINTIVKLQLKAGEANPSPPVGPALGAKGINIPKFCSEFNAETIKTLEKGTLVPVIVTIYTDKSFTFIIKSPPVSILLKKIANITKGSKFPNKNKIATITQAQAEEIVKIKSADLIVNSTKSAIKSIIGTAKSMGIEIN
ncbi:MAG TPA: 50S ribosomal protein L11 [Candidatus Azoamicus sp. OHIO1]